MIIYCRQSDGVPVMALYDEEIKRTDLAVLAPYNEYEIDDIEDTKVLRSKIRNTLNKVDRDGDSAFYLVAGELQENIEWAEII